ncbi:tRNA (N(6)-L-threonylcarbamoyladenosine(37)-C(2))-methylthiotransferase MtaB [Thermoanaerobacterium sp. CMT5567-10]|uniref:tRNA (N(6)-L-threonylcarbamoyladenosine(37)-C(2))- methylthiotransferase MtaB n=1 Tax=Thermoanaerobacterium sp. CMT5567-10 TaxID=3061989 RepID=UPI0026E0156E|nr:tRNA (N(6)-L-threonylcarbamoyladenosine(37)-C(2))-methylthiotransferase MtaB [Thermoanaerobacterium sp. CMT5567-10]WKV08827.1 tRNA (N(6)-L-threonylcarbamoyladenosine(37)-C(2))-methylthiotransferase MtaB [Thermoanaerobacterium sp. CMT5567-10]
MAKANLAFNNEEFYNIYGRKKIVSFFTLGCKVNQYETEAMVEIFKNSGYDVVNFNEYADVYIINTCTVTGRGDMKSRQEIRKAKKINPDSIIAVVGCYSQVASNEVLDLPEVNVVLGTKNKGEVVKLVEKVSGDREKINAVENIFDNKKFEELKISAQEGHTRAYLKIQDGCNQFCTYCIIPYARGPVRSRKPDNILDEVKRLRDNGYKEVILTGIHVASYGKDLENINLLDIIKMIHEVDGIERIRMSSIEPTFLTEDFIKEVAHLPKFCRHYHVSLQSGSDSTLKRMGRKYTTREYSEIIDRIRKHIKDVAITTDVMVGFPGETDEEFNETFNFVKAIEFSKMHVFKYSRRAGTKAANYPDQVKNSVKEERSKLLIKLSEENEIKFYKKFIGTTLNVLFEQNVKDFEGYVEGLTDNYIRVAVKSDLKIKNNILPVKLIETKRDFVIGKMVEGGENNE